MPVPISAWTDLMTETLTRESVVSRDAYGAPSYGAPITYKCRMFARHTRVRGISADGQEILESHRVWVNTIFTPNHDDRFTLPDGTQPLLLTYEIPHDENGPHHLKLVFGGAMFGGSRG